MVSPPSRLAQATSPLQIQGILRRATVFSPFKLSQAVLLLRIQCALGWTTFSPLSKRSQAALLLSREPSWADHGFRCKSTTNHYIEHRCKFLALNRSDSLSSAEMPSPCDNLRFVDPASQEPLPVAASQIIEAISRSSSVLKRSDIIIRAQRGNRAESDEGRQQAALECSGGTAKDRLVCIGGK